MKLSEITAQQACKHPFVDKLTMGNYKVERCCKCLEILKKTLNK